MANLNTPKSFLMKMNYEMFTMIRILYKLAGNITKVKVYGQMFSIYKINTFTMIYIIIK